MSDIKQLLKLKEIDQLDSAILQFSKNTLTTKKICGTILISITAIILKITENKLDLSIYVSCAVTLLIFWFIDANSYYYQRKLRIRMTKIVNELKGEESLFDGYGMPLNNDEKPSWVKSFFNRSQFFYFLGLMIVIILLIIDRLEYI